MVQAQELIQPVRSDQGDTSSEAESLEIEEGGQFRLSDWILQAPQRHLENFIKSCFLRVVSHCIEELSVLRNVFATVTEQYQSLNLDYKTIDERFGKEANMDEITLNAEYGDIDKLQKDIAVIIFLLKSIIDEASAYSSLDNVNGYMNNLDSMNEDEERFIQDLRDKHGLVSFLRLAIVREREESFSAVNLYNESIKKAMRQFHDQEAYSKGEVNFTTKWQNARYEQNRIKLKQKENNYIDTAKNMQHEIYLENRCHEELESFISESYRDYMNEIQHWMDQYEDNIESKESETYNLRMDLEKLSDEKEALQLEYEERKQAMQDWIEYKIKKKEEAERAVLENWAATTIQFWWRQVMMTKKLGPYRKKPKKNKKDKKDKKKK